jgi:hypothetical protein
MEPTNGNKAAAPKGAAVFVFTARRIAGKPM